jgi:(p)ppGpp synthase/HD superfamily hydrolase
MKTNEVINPNPGADLIDLARRLATAAHKDQLYGTQPYMVHIEDVVRRVKQITTDPEIICAAYLHDVVEDTDIALSQIRSMFGENVANMVWAVTGEGVTRADKMANAIEKIAQTPGADFVKSADRLSNAAASKAEQKMKLYQRYKDEHTNLSPVLGNNTLAKELIKLFSE